MKRGNTSTWCKTKEEESEEIDNRHQREEEEEEDKEDLKDKPQNNKPQPNKSPNNKPEHVLHEISFVTHLHLSQYLSPINHMISFFNYHQH